MDWLMKIDPEWLIILIGGAYAYFKGGRAGVKNANTLTLLVDKMRQEYVNHFNTPESARAKFTELAWSLLTAAKQKKNSVTELLVTTAVEKAMSEFDREVRTREDLKKQLAEMVVAVKRVGDAFKVGPLVPNNGPQVQKACGFTYSGPGSWCKRLPGHDGDHGEGD